MNTPYLISSKQIKTDGIYYCIKQAHPDRDDFKDSFLFHGLALTPSNKLFITSKNFKQNEWEIYDYGVKGVLKAFMVQIEDVRLHGIVPSYDVTFNTNNLTANYQCCDFQETVVCTLYSSNKLQVKSYLQPISENYINESGGNIHDFIAFKEIKSGISSALENSLYPIKKKKHWWNL